MTPVYKASITVNTYQVDMNNRIRLSSLFLYMQEVASAHASQLGLGYEMLVDTGLLWVLSWARVEIDLLPGFGEAITLTTWPKKRYRLFSIRDFLFTDEEGVCFARASTAWLLIDAARRRAVPLENLPRPVPYRADQAALDELPEKLLIVVSPELLYTRNVSYSDLDLYGHVNNARYVDFILDAYDQSFHRAHQPKALAISFRSEAVYGDPLEIRRGVTPENQALHRLEGVNQETRKTVFQAVLEWESSPPG